DARQHLASVDSAVSKLGWSGLREFSGDAADTFDVNESVESRSEAGGRSTGTHVGCESEPLHHSRSEVSPRCRQSTRQCSPIFLMEYFGVQRCSDPSQMVGNKERETGIEPATSAWEIGCRLKIKNNRVHCIPF